MIRKLSEPLQRIYRFPAIVPHTIQLHLELSKARLSLLVLATTLVGFILASGDRMLDVGKLIGVLLGTAGVAAGANALNQWLEVDPDARMERTRRRPLPSGQLSPRYALRWAIGIAVLGGATLLMYAGTLAAALATLDLLIYVLIYTPMKPRSPFCTLVGAVCGAIPPMIGWTAVTGRLDLGAWVLGAILFIWQIPHFMSLAWLYREDYARGGFRMLPVMDPNGTFTTGIIIIYTLALIPVALAASIIGLTGWWYAGGSLLLGVTFLLLGIRLAQGRTNLHARRVFFASLVYLPFLLGLMVADQRVPTSPRPLPIETVERPAAPVHVVPFPLSDYNIPVNG